MEVDEKVRDDEPEPATTHHRHRPQHRHPTDVDSKEEDNVVTSATPNAVTPVTTNAVTSAKASSANNDAVTPAKPDTVTVGRATADSGNRDQAPIQTRDDDWDQPLNSMATRGVKRPTGLRPQSAVPSGRRRGIRRTKRGINTHSAAQALQAVVSPDARSKNVWAFMATKTVAKSTANNTANNAANSTANTLANSTAKTSANTAFKSAAKSAITAADKSEDLEVSAPTFSGAHTHREEVSEGGHAFNGAHTSEGSHTYRSYFATDATQQACAQCQAVTDLPVAAAAAINAHPRCLEAVLAQQQFSRFLKWEDGSGRNPLHFAAACDSLECARLLLDFGYGVADSDHESRDALYYACCNGAFATAALLVDISTDLNRGDVAGDTPLHGAVVNGHGEIVQLLARCGADPNLTNQSGHTPAYYANDGGMLEVLFEGGGNLFCVDENGRTLLFEACAKAFIGCAAFLCQIDDDQLLLQYPDHRQDTPLHAAAANGNMQCVKLLLGYAASPRPRNVAGLTAHDLALAAGHPECARLLGTYSDYHEDDATPAHSNS